jgi:hypothetical protein
MLLKDIVERFLEQDASAKLLYDCHWKEGCLFERDQGIVQIGGFELLISGHVSTSLPPASWDT